MQEYVAGGVVVVRRYPMAVPKVEVAKLLAELIHIGAGCDPVAWCCVLLGLRKKVTWNSRNLNDKTLSYSIATTAPPELSLQYHDPPLRYWCFRFSANRRFLEAFDEIVDATTSLPVPAILFSQISTTRQVQCCSERRLLRLLGSSAMRRVIYASSGFHTCSHYSLVWCC
jgi:hypothetical protein